MTEGESPLFYLGLLVLILGVLYFFIFPFLSFGSNVSDPQGWIAGVNVDQRPSMVDITVITTGNLDSALLAEPGGLTGSNGTRSTVMRSLSPGDRFTLRSNDEVINFLNNPENNITVPTISGTKTVENVGELPFEYRKAPAGFVNPDANISSYDNASVATVACLYRSGDDFKLGGRQIPTGAPIPCSTPFLAQRIDDEDILSTHVKPTSGPNKGKTLVSPITLKEGEHHLVGTIEGQETVVQSVNVTDELAGGEG